MKELQQQNSDAARENGSSVPRSRSRSPLPPTSRILKVRRPEKVDRKQWPFSMTTYMPELDDGIALDSIKGRLFGQALFGPEVAVVVICFHSDDKIKATVCGETELLRCLTETQDGPKFQLFYITMTLQYKLRISAEIFQQLASCYELPMTFIDHLLRYQEQIIHFGHRLQLCGPRDSLIYDFWYLLPVRLSMGCSDPQDMHKKYSTGRNQMNPFHHLHLNGERGKTDIRGFEIAVFFRHDVSSKKATVICINFHSLGRQPVEEVQHRILHTLEAGGNDMMDRNPFWVHLVYVSIVLRWWKTAMGFFEEGLICHEKRIEAKMMAQSEENAGTATRGDTVETNRSLHAMTAHSLRYETELAAIKSVVLELIQQHEELASLLQLGTHEKERVSRALKQQLAEVNSVAQKQRELAKKAKNTIALLFHSVQADYDQQQVSNGTDLQQILRLGRNDAVNTFELALQTKNDSFAMKTIAIMTMAFLPGTSFAAVLALPYFQGSSTKRTLWIWAILSGTFTIVIFVLFRWLWSKRSTKKLWNPATEEI